jgi:hypothetical protein
MSGMQLILGEVGGQRIQNIRSGGHAYIPREDGDLYLDLDTGGVYQKVAGQWVLRMNMIGSKWYNGHGVPA